MEHADYLILLVGKNPIPNLISALNCSNSDTDIFLCYTAQSENNISTLNVAENIEEEIKRLIKSITVNKVLVDKENVQEIKKTIKDKIISKIDVGENKNIVLDCTGSTKLISAIFYDEFSKIESNVYFSYVSDKEKNVTIYDQNQRISRNKNKDIALKYDISANNILRLHGFKEDVAREYKQFNIEDITSDGFTLIINYKLKNTVKNKKNIINNFFEINSISEKLGGSNVRYFIKFILDGDTIEKVEEEFYKDIENITDISDIRDKITLEVLEG